MIMIDAAQGNVSKMQVSSFSLSVLAVRIGAKENAGWGTTIKTAAIAGVKSWDSMQ